MTQDTRVDIDVDVILTIAGMSSEVSFVSSDTTLVVALSGPCRVPVTVRSFWSVPEEAGQVLVARKHVGQSLGTSDQFGGGGGSHAIENQDDREADEAQSQREGEHHGCRKGLVPLATFIVKMLLYEDPVG